MPNECPSERFFAEVAWEPKATICVILRRSVKNKNNHVTVVFRKRLWALEGRNRVDNLHLLFWQLLLDLTRLLSDLYGVLVNRLQVRLLLLRFFGHFLLDHPLQFVHVNGRTFWRQDGVGLAVKVVVGRLDRCRNRISAIDVSKDMFQTFSVSLHPRTVPIPSQGRLCNILHRFTTLVHEKQICVAFEGLLKNLVINCCHLLLVFLN